MPESLSARSRLSDTGSAGGLAAGSFRRAGPRPVLGASHQPRAHRIRFDIRDHRSKFLVRSDPPVEILTLPERLPFPSCDAVGSHRGGGLNPSQNLGQLLMRLQYHVNVIRHNYPCVQIVTAPNSFAIKKRPHKRVGNIRVSQPSRAVSRAIQLPIMQQESSPRVRIHDEKCWRGQRQRARQPPCEENYRVLRDPMRKSSIPEHDSPGTGGKTAGAPWLRRYRHGVLASAKFS